MRNYIVILRVNADEVYEPHLEKLFGEIIPPKGVEITDVHVETEPTDDSQASPNAQSL